MVDLLRYEGRAVAWTSTALPDADAHAGETETSLLRYLAPWAVRVDLMAAGATEPVAELMPRLRDEGVRGGLPERRARRPDDQQRGAGPGAVRAAGPQPGGRAGRPRRDRNGRLAGVTLSREPLGTP